MPILHRLATVYNASDDRQTNRAIGTGRLCSYIGGIKTELNKSVVSHCSASRRVALDLVKNSDLDMTQIRHTNAICSGRQQSFPG